MDYEYIMGYRRFNSKQFEDKYYYPRYGYGTMLDKYLNDNVKVVNIALSGRSSKSYLSEPEYNTLINGMIYKSCW